MDKVSEDENKTELEEEPVDEDEQIAKELENLTKEEAARLKRARRRANEKRTKTIQRMQLNMVIPTEIGMEQDGPGASLFTLAKIDKAGVSICISFGYVMIP